MPTSNNIIGACQLYYAGFGFAGRPAVMWFDGVPVKDGAGVAVTLPTVEIIHDRVEPELYFDGLTLDRHFLRIVVRAAKLDDAGAIALGIKYNGGTPGQFLGFDGAGADNSGVAFPLATGQKLKSFTRQAGEKMSREAARDQNAAPVHRIDIPYVAEVQVG